ncbi:unnamed protein product [Pleuronectes platessa]|uniref:Uncharacterized protein n=1 Tax=Pleuronectes platessa TaxID=8262 RepID=A0A9N7VT32_PLEPL|nr:unnamed protein product [Pleuronectes platessa]
MCQVVLKAENLFFKSICGVFDLSSSLRAASILPLTLHLNLLLHIQHGPGFKVPVTEQLHAALPHQSSSMALAKRANGKWTAGTPAAHAAHVLFMSRGRRDAPRHTPCQKHTALRTGASHYTPTSKPPPSH